MGTSAFVRKIYTNVKIDWQTLLQQQGYKVDLPVWILCDGGHKSSFTFLSCKEIENLALYYVGYPPPFSPFSQWIETPLLLGDPQRKSAEEASTHKVLVYFYQLLFSNTTLGQMFKGWHGFSSPTQSHTRLVNRNVYWRNSVALFSEEA